MTPPPPVRTCLGWRSLAVTGLMVAAGLGLNWAFQPVLHGGRFLVPILAVALAAQLGGVVAGLVATVLGAVGVVLLFFEPLGSLRLSVANEAFQTLLFVAIGTALSLVADARRRALGAEMQARAAADEQVRRTATLNQFLRSLVDSPPDPAVRAAIVTNFIVETLGDVAVVLAGNGERWQVLATAASPPSGDLQSEAVARFTAADRSPLSPAWVAQSGRPVALAVTAETTGPVLQALWRAGARGVRLVPLPGNRGVVGVLVVVYGAGRAAAFGSDDGLVTSVALRAGAALDSARLFREAQQAVAERDRLVAIVSHDLKNPLHVALMSLDVLRRTLGTPTSATVATVVDSLERACQRMNFLIRDLLDLTRMAAGHLVLQCRPLAVGDLVRQAVAVVTPLARQKSQQLHVATGGAVPVLVADADRLMQVLVNLLDNAVKFTPEGGTIRVAVTATDTTLAVAVTDTGPGLKPEDLSLVFERYWQADHTYGQGTGLGLSIAKGLIELHGGRVWVQNGPQGGATFGFTLPLAAGEVQAA